MIPAVIWGAANVSRGLSLLHKGWKIGTGKYGKAVYKDIVRKGSAYIKTAKKAWKDPNYSLFRRGDKSTLHYNKPKPILTASGRHSTRGGKPQYTAETLNLHRSRKMAMVEQRRREITAGGGRWSKESKTVGKAGLLGYVAHATYTADYGEDELKPKKEENGDNGKKIEGTTKPAGIDPKKKLESNTSADTPGRVVTPESNEKISGDKGSEQIVIPSTTGSNIKVPYTKYKPQAYSQYFVGRDAPNEAYRKLQSEGLKRYNPQNLERKRKYLRSL